MRFLAFLLFPFLICAEEYQPRNTQKEGEEPPTPEEARAAITVPDGFSVTLFAGEPDVRQPVAMALDPRGRLWVAESYSYKEWGEKGEDRILIFEDTDNDGVHDSRKVFWSGGNHVSGMTVGWGGVWVCDSPNLLFIPDRDHNDVPDGEPEVILEGWTTKAGHNFFNGLTIGIDGWLYGRHGITKGSKVGRPDQPDEDRLEFDCAIWRYHPYSKDFEVVCRGTTNPWGLDWNAVGDAFFTNNVNGHLWHLIPGAYYPRMGERNDPYSSHIYSRIGMTCDHLHHAGAHTDWTKTRDGLGVHGQLGGGHAHSGGMIYLGGKWPPAYEGRIFMANVHGRRVNMDRLDPEKSGYVGRHEEDFLLANQPWFKGVQLLYGPDGDVYLSDWTDLGECHDNDGVHRTSGRIYKIIHGQPSPPLERNLRSLSDSELAALQTHPNEWHARTSRMLLQERMQDETLEQPIQAYSFLKKLGNNRQAPTAHRIRALLTLHAMTLLKGEQLESLVHESNEQIRAWGVRLCTEPAYAEQEAIGIVFKRDDPSPVVHLAWASLLRNAEGASLWAIAADLARAPGVADDPNLPHMIWYGIKDAVEREPEDAAHFLGRCPVPLLRRHTARRLAESGHLDALYTTLELEGDRGARNDIARGLADGLKGTKAKSSEWLQLRKDLDLDPEIQKEIDWQLDRAGEVKRLNLTLSVRESEPSEKKEAMARLSSIKNKDALPFLIAALGDGEFQAEAIRGLGKYPEKMAASALVKGYTDLDPKNQSAAILSLCSSPNHATALLDALEKGTIPRSAVTAYHARQIQGMKKGELVARLKKVWGTTGRTRGERQAEIKRWQNQLLPDVLAQADLARGKLKFQQLCATCHQLNGTGKEIGPDLTGANRADLYYLLENIIDPSATLPRDYRLVTITKKDGAVLAGNVTAENEYSITLRTLTDDSIISLEDIASREVSDVSLMPEGLLQALSAEEVRDLIGFLQQ